MEPTIITNGTLLSEAALECLLANKARIKISLHGPKTLHDTLQGKAVYDKILSNLRTLVSVGIETSIHTLIHAGITLNLREWVKFLVSEGVHKVSFMNFVARERLHVATRRTFEKIMKDSRTTRM